MAKVLAPEKSPPAQPAVDLGPKVRAHQRYYIDGLDGKKVRVPGATTVVSLLEKPGLTHWANKLGLEGIDSELYKTESAAIGTLAHHLIECEFLDQTADLRDYTQAQLELALVAVESFHVWKAQHRLEPVLLEGQLVSQKYGFGGTIDFYGKVDGLSTLLDFKTSGDIYESHRIQVAGAYAQLLAEHGHPVHVIRILRVGRDGSWSEESIPVAHVPVYWRMFRALLEIYQLRKELKA